MQRQPASSGIALMSELTYPEIKDIFVRKAEARLERARLTYGQKVLIVEKMRREVQPLHEAGDRRLKRLRG